MLYLYLSKQVQLGFRKAGGAAVCKHINNAHLKKHNLTIQWCVAATQILLWTIPVESMDPFSQMSTKYVLLPSTHFWAYKKRNKKDISVIHWVTMSDPNSLMMVEEASDKLSTCAYWLVMLWQWWPKHLIHIIFILISIQWAHMARSTCTHYCFSTHLLWSHNHT